MTCRSAGARSLYNPIGDVRDYFGDEIALYFAWMGIYTQSLLFPSVLGLATFILRMANHQTNDE